MKDARAVGDRARLLLDAGAVVLPRLAPWAVFVVWLWTAMAVVEATTPEWCDSIANGYCVWDTHAQALPALLAAFSIPLVVSGVFCVWAKCFKAWACLVVGGWGLGWLTGQLGSQRAIGTGEGVLVGLLFFVGVPAAAAIAGFATGEVRRRPGTSLALAGAVALSAGWAMTYPATPGEAINAFDLSFQVVFVGVWIALGIIGVWGGAAWRREKFPLAEDSPTG